MSFSKDNSSTSSKVDVPLRKSDLRGLKNALLSLYFPEELDEPSDQTLTAIFSPNALITRRKLNKSTSVIFRRGPKEPILGSKWPYVSPEMNIPLLIEMSTSKKNTGTSLVPCLSLLSMFPTMLPSVIVHPAASKYLCGGADLMKAGILTIKSATIKDQETSAGNDITSNPPPPPLQPGSLVSITANGNPQPFALGFFTNSMSSSTQFGYGVKGVAVEVVNCYGDDLWKRHHLAVKSGSALGKSAVGGEVVDYEDGHFGNKGFIEGKLVVSLVAGDEDSDDSSEEEEGGDNAADEVVTSNDTVVVGGDEPSSTTDENDLLASQPPADLPPVPPEPSFPPDDSNQDLLLDYCFKKALLTTVKNSMFPLVVSTFYSQHLTPARPTGTNLEIKKTQYKKITAFLKAMAGGSDPMVSIAPSKDKKDEVAFLKGFNKSHYLLREFKKRMNEVSAGGGGTDVAALTVAMAGQAAKLSGRKLKVVPLIIMPKSMIQTLNLDADDCAATNAKSEARRGTGFLTHIEAREIIFSYVEANDLIDPNDRGSVILDGPLSDAIFKRTKREIQAVKSSGSNEEEFPLSCTKQVLIEKMQAKLEVAHAIVLMPGSEVLQLKKGNPQTITIEVEARQNRKFITRVRGVEYYDINADKFATDCATRFACAAGVDTEAENRAALKKNMAEIILQGRLDMEIQSLLTGNDKFSSHGGAKNGSYDLPAEVISVVLGKNVSKGKKK